MTAAPVRPWPGGENSRALCALLYVALGASLILLYAEPIATHAAAIFSGPDADISLWFRIAIPAVIIALALIGALLFAERFRWAGAHFALVVSALPLGVCAVAVILAIVASAGYVLMMPPMPESPGIISFFTGTFLILFAVVGEELLLRGLLQPILQRAWGPIFAITIAAMAFTMVHFAGGWRDPVSLLNIFLGGIWFGLLAFRTEGLAAPILAHFGYNWAEEMLFGASPNPGVSNFGSALDLDITGPTIWGGSVDGLNASLALSAVMVVIIVALVFFFSNHPPVRTEVAPPQ